jgi:protein TonB
MDFSKDGKGGGRNLTGIGFVIVLHLLVGYAVVSGLGKRMITKMAEPVETKIIEEVKPPPPKDLPPPPPPPKTVAPPPPFIPPPEIQVNSPPPPSPIATSTSVAPESRELARPTPPTQPGPPAPPQTSNVAATINVKDCPTPEYPRQSQRNEETGTVVIRFLVGANGAVKSSEIQKSSGFRELDKAAQRSIGSCNKFKPGIVNGAPVESYAVVAYEWKLE